MSTGKSISKMIGVKSVFVDNDKIINVAFGKGNEAKIKCTYNNGSLEAEEPEKPYFSQLKNGNIKDKPRKLMKVSDDKIRDPETVLEKEYCDRATDSETLTSYVEQLEGVKEDVLGMKSILEKEYYGRTFNDNIHIQIIHQIQDIYKALAIYSNLIGYTINSIAESAQKNDNKQENCKRGVDYAGEIISKGTVAYKDCYQTNIESFRKFIPENGCGRLAYFPDIFCKTRNNTKEKLILRDEKDIYTAIRAAVILRNTVSEDRTNVDIFSSDKKKNAIIPPNQQEKDAYDELLIFLNTTVEKKLAQINNNFIKLNYNLVLVPLAAGYKKTIMNNYGDVDVDFIDDYYKFAICKSGKNIGLSIKELREVLLKREKFKEYKDKFYDSKRGKIYGMLDFIICKCLNQNAVKLNEYIDRLRKSADENEKQAIYLDTAEYLEKLIFNNFSEAVKVMNKRIKDKTDKDKKTVEEERKIFDKWAKTSKEKISAENMSFLSKYLYFMSLYLDKKETNDLFTTLIHRMENINAFNDVLKELNSPNEFESKYSVFKYSQEIADELRILNSLSNMKDEKPITKTMYIDAGKLLGFREEMMDYYEKEDNKTKPLRNFINNNIIDSRKFIYITRYSNVTDVSKLMKSKPLVSFVLNEFDKIDNGVSENQVERYYKSVNPKGDGKDKIAYLTDLLNNINYGELAEVKNKVNKNNPYENELKEKYKAVLGLYLSVAYNIVKNLVYINSRYVSAFQSFEYDSRKLLKDYDKEKRAYLILPAYYCGFDAKRIVKNEKNKQSTIFVAYNTDGEEREGDEKFTEKFNLKAADIVKLRRLKREASSIIQSNIQTIQIGNEIIKLGQNELNVYCGKFRNAACHLAVLSRLSYAELIGTGKKNEIRKDFKISSYYEVYHFIIQRILQNDDELAKYKDNHPDIFEKYSSYNKNVVKMYCIPFAYNLSRYKALTTEPIFDKNRNNLKKPIKFEKAAKLSIEKSFVNEGGQQREEDCLVVKYGDSSDPAKIEGREKSAKRIPLNKIIKLVKKYESITIPDEVQNALTRNGASIITDSRIAYSSIFLKNE